jgi:DNA-directed RNA polymerase specialized sigma subunit
MGKVTGSSSEFPYIEVHTTVQMDEPGESDSVKKLISIKKARKKQVSAVMIEIEQFIAGIPDSIDRQIFELTYLEKKKQREVAEIVGLEQSSISKRITSYLKLSYNS